MDPGTGGRRTGRAGRKLALLLASSLVSLLAAEGALRLLVPYVGWRQFKDLSLGWSSAEFQDFDPEEPKPSGVTRLLFLGDSYLAGGGVSRLDQRFPRLLAERLGERYEVAVLASAGWGTDQELLAYMQKGAAWSPDLVVLAFCANNDLSNNLSNTHGRQSRKPYFVLGDDGALRLFDARGAPLDFAARPAQRSAGFQSYLLDLLRDRLQRADAQAPPAIAEPTAVDPRYLRFDAKGERLSELWSGDEMSWSPQEGVNLVSAYIHEDFETNRYQWALFDALLAELARATDASGARLVVMLLPVTLRPRDGRFVVGSDYERVYATPAGDFTFRAREPRERLARAAQRAGVPLYDPCGDFLALLAMRSLEASAWPGADRHFSDSAHALLAEILERDLREGRLPAR